MKTEKIRTPSRAIASLRWVVVVAFLACFALSVTGLLVSSLTFERVWLAGIGLAGAVVVAFWKPLDEFLRTHRVKAGPVECWPESPRASEKSSVKDEADGNKRDRLLFAGNGKLSERQYGEAYGLYYAANLLNESILSAFRCMQCSALLGREADTTKWLCEALVLADRAPAHELVNRGQFREWVLQHRAYGPQQLAKDARAIDF